MNSHHNQSNSYKGQHLIRAGLQVQRFSPWQHTGTHGAGGTESSASPSEGRPALQYQGWEMLFMVNGSVDLILLGYRYHLLLITNYDLSLAMYSMMAVVQTLKREKLVLKAYTTLPDLFFFNSW